MKVFFTASQRGRREYKKQYEEIYKILEEAGLKHLDDTIVSIPDERFYKNLLKDGREANLKLYRKNIEAIQRADVVVFECSLHSLSIGFMIEKALEMNKPTIVLYYESKLPFFLDGIENEKLIVREYTLRVLRSILDEAVDEARHMQDKRFNFFISPGLLTYLEEESRREGMTKSALIRRLIISQMKKKS